MRRPSYSAVTGVTVALAVLCAIRIGCQDLIPPPHPEVAEWGQGDFVGRGKVQDVPWRKLEPKTFLEAQRLARPLLIVVGVPWSEIGRKADRAFANPDVSRAISRGFVPVRVDAAQDPRWLSQFLPLQRIQLGFGVGFQVWVFDLKGRLIAFVGRLDARDPLDGDSILRALVSAQNAFGAAVLSDDDPELQASNRRDVDRLQSPGMANLSLANSARALMTNIDSHWGGWNVRGLVGLRPVTIRFLQLAGEWEGAAQSLRHAALTSRADWLDGGFYRVVRTEDGTPEYDKAAVPNAQMAETLAVQDAMRPDPLLRKRAESAVRWLLGLRTGVLVPGGEMGDEDERDRSERASFAPRRLREAVSAGLLKDDLRIWAEANLGFAEPARLAVPTESASQDPKLESVLTALRRAAGQPRSDVARGLCDVNGNVAACLLRCARLWGDRDLAIAAGDIVDALGVKFSSPQGMRHSLNTLPGDPAFLSDALAYADAALQDFLTNGRVPSLERGAAELRRALKTFGEPGGAFLRTGAVGTQLMPGQAPLPQFTDDEGEATAAMALRLLDAYAQVFGPDGRDFAAWADRLGTRLAAVTDAAPSMGGALGALARHLDSRAAFVVGTDAGPHADRLVRRFPNRLIVPVLGSVRRDLVGRPPGIYLATSLGIAGPFDDASLARRLPTDLEVGL